MQRKIGFAVAGVMATLGALLVFLYLKDNRNSSTAASDPAVTVADDATTSEVASDRTGTDDTDTASGDLASTVEAPEDGSLTAVLPTNEIVEFGDPVIVPPDYLQVTFTLPTERALGGRIRPGDTVAVVVSFNEVLDNGEGGGEPVQTTDVLLHKALVADVQVQDVLGATTSTTGIGTEVPEGALNGTNAQTYSITIAVPATQVERLVFALEYGSVWLAYQGAEAGETTNGIVTAENIHQEVSIFINRDDLVAPAEDETEEAPADLAFNLDDGSQTEGEG